MTDIERAADGALTRFIEAAISYDGDDCLLWPFHVTSGGYAKLTINGKSVRGHRVVCERVKGPPPGPDYDAAHECGVRRCINPRHLNWKTRQANMDDQIRHGTRLSGEAINHAKLTAPDIDLIRASYPAKTQKELASEFKISRRRISEILVGGCWGFASPAAGVVAHRNRTKPTKCSVDGCEKPPDRCGMCWAHYCRFKRHGNPLAGRRPMEAPQ